MTDERENRGQPAHAGPFPILGMRRRTRTNGAPYMVAVLDVDLVLPAGSELHLRRLHDGRLTSPEFCLQVVPPQRAVTRKQRDEARADRLDGCGIRVDPRDENHDAEAQP